jgi:hypothetical protein
VASSQLSALSKEGHLTRLPSLQQADRSIPPAERGNRFKANNRIPGFDVNQFSARHRCCYAADPERGADVAQKAHNSGPSNLSTAIKLPKHELKC